MSLTRLPAFQFNAIGFKAAAPYQCLDYIALWVPNFYFVSRLLNTGFEHGSRHRPHLEVIKQV